MFRISFVATKTKCRCQMYYVIGSSLIGTLQPLTCGVSAALASFGIVRLRVRLVVHTWAEIL